MREAVTAITCDNGIVVATFDEPAMAQVKIDDARGASELVAFEVPDPRPGRETTTVYVNPDRVIVVGDLVKRSPLHAVE